jgi:sec-independent protein translocase protein TatC
MGDEVPDEGADDAPDPESGEEPSARADDDAGTPEDASNDADTPEDAGTETGSPPGSTDADGDGETGTDEGDADGELWADITVPEDASTGDAGDAGGEPVDAGAGGPTDDEAAADGTTDEETAGVGDEVDGGNTDGADDVEDDAGDGDGDGDGIPDDYDPFQPSVDLDYGAHQYPSPAADDDGEGEEPDADGSGTDGPDDTDDVDGTASTDDADAGAGGASSDAGHAPDPEEMTEEWSADEVVPGGDMGEAGDASAAKSDGGYADGTDAVGGYEPVTEDDEELFEGPPDDQEMPLADHIEEMVRRLGVVLVVMAIVSGIVFPFGERIINFLWYSVLVSDPVPQPRVYHPLALVLARLKVATLAGFIVALPVFVYESYLFMRPGLYPHERRYYLASVPTSLVLATVGVLFAYFLVLPALFTYFLYYSDEVTIIAFGLTETFDLMVLMLGGFAFIFQIPLFVMLAIMMGLTTRQWMADRRLYFWGAFLGLAFLFSPDPTGMAPIIVAATMVALFEGTLFLLKWTKRGRRRAPGG